MTLSVPPGTLIDERYRVISRVGSGGMAEVYCAEDVQLGRRVAVKLLHERFAADEEFVERFRREASSAASLSHANIVSVYDRGQWAGTYYIVMEYLDGRSLDSIVREESPLPPDRAIEIIEQVLRAARFAHRRGVVHRDLKPHNVIIDDEGRVKVTDFGIARAGASEITQTGSIMGTARYLSPEQAQGHPVGPRGDLYAIGVMLYELLTGAVPFEGESVVAIALRHLSEPPRPPSSLVPSISPALDAAVLRALAKDPDERFADADEFLGALDDERARIRGEAGAQTASLAPIVLPPAPLATHPATYTTQAIGPITGPHGQTGVSWWDPNTTGIISPSAVVVPGPPPPPPRRPVWPWFALATVLAVAIIVALVLLLDKPKHTVAVPRVPTVVGLTKLVAGARLSDEGYVPLYNLIPSAKVRAGRVISQRPGAGTRLPHRSTVALFVSSGPAIVRHQIPARVQHAKLRAAERLLRAAGFKVSRSPEASTSVPKNTVISTTPPIGTLLRTGQTVVVTYSSGPPPVAVPNVVGETLDQARPLLQARQFVVGTVEKSSTEPVGTILKQSPASGKAPQGSTITLTVAKALPDVAVPSLVGLKAAVAGARLGKAGLTPVPITIVKDVNPQYDGLVISQQPRVGVAVPPGSQVVIRIEQYEAPVGPTPPNQTGPTGPTNTTGPTGTTGATPTTSATGLTGVT